MTKVSNFEKSNKTNRENLEKARNIFFEIFRGFRPTNRTALKSLQNPAKMIIPSRRSVAGVPQRRKTILAIIALLVSLVALLCPAAVIPSNVSSSPLCTEPGADDLVGWMVAQWETARAVDKSCHGYVLADLPSAGHSLWACIQKNGRDAAYTEFMGLDQAGFSKLEQAFTPLFNAEVNRRKPKGSNRGRPRRLKSQDVLALTLQYLRDGVDQKHFQGDFGAPSSNISRGIQLGLDVLPHALLTFEAARVDWPDHVEMEDYVKKILHRHPDLEGRRVFGFVDRLNLEIESPAEPGENNAYYNAWLGGCFCSSIIVYGPDGRIIWARGNAPGTCHDSKIAKPLYETLLQTCDHEDGAFALAADSAFKASGGPTPLHGNPAWACSRSSSSLLLSTSHPRYKMNTFPA